MSKLVTGERAGAAALMMGLQQASVGAALNAHYDRCKRAGTVEGATPEDKLALGNLWMLHQDLLGYALLGDPAVQLPVAGRAAPAAAARRPGAGASAEVATTTAAAPAAGADVDPAVVDRLEQAALAFAARESATVIADRLGLTRMAVKELAEVYRQAGRAALAAWHETQEKGRDR